MSRLQGSDLDHAAEQRAHVGRHERRDVEHAALHLLEQRAQVVVVERQRALREELSIREMTR